MADIPRNPNALRMIKCYFCGTSNFVEPQYKAGSQMPCTKCGKDILVPFMLRDFEVRQAIASGGMGTVYRAFDTVLHREVAVKLMKPELAKDSKKLEEFYREAKVIAALNHPHIIQVFHFGEFEGKNFIAMELADHGSLEDRIREKGRIPEVEVLDVGVKIGGALGYALEKELLHRDIKPANILFNAAGEPKLVDWGLATSSESATDWGTGEIWGTPEYVAPEKVRREAETFHADMYSLGATLFEALTGQVPFKCASVQDTVNAHVHEPVPSPRKVVPEISGATDEAIAKLLAKHPKERFTDYNEMVMTLTGARSQVLVGQLVAQNPEPGGLSIRRTTGRMGRASAAGAGIATAGAANAPRKKTGPMIAIAVVALAALGAGGFFLLQKKDGERADAPPVPATNTAAAVIPSATNIATSPPALKPLPKTERPQITSPWLNLSDAAATNVWRAWGASRAFPAGTWKSQGGALSVTSTNRATIVVKERYIDFEFSFDWKAEAGTRASVIFAINEGIENPTGNALRVPLGDDDGIQGGARGRNSTASIAGLFGPNTNKALKPLGQFNHTRLVVLKDKVEVWLNYQKVNDISLASQRFKDALAQNEQLKNRPYLGKTTGGYVGFAPSPGFAVRNARIRAIAENPPAPKPPATFTMPAPPPKAPAKKKKG